MGIRSLLGGLFSGGGGELEWETLAEGDGDMAVPGRSVTVHYTGWLTNGTKFDSSHDRVKPFTFRLGARA